MPKFKVEIARTYTEVESCERVIEAPDAKTALAYAWTLAGQFNQDCPDDVTETGRGEGAGDFYVEDGPLAVQLMPDTAKADYVIVDGDILTTKDNADG